MGKPGCRPKPTAIRKLHGSRKKTVNEPEPSEVIGDIHPPEWLSEDAVKVWVDLYPKLQAYHLLTDIDLNLLALYCQATGRYMQDGKFLNTQKSIAYTIKDDHGNFKCLAQFPQASSERNNAKLIMQLGAELGLSPASRTRISLPYAPKEKSKDEKKKKRFFTV